MFAGEIRRKRVDRMRSHTHWKWHLDEVYVKINGEMYYLWRAVDHEGEVLESLVTKTRDKAAALKFIKKATKRHGKAEAITTDGLRSYKAAMSEIGNAEKQGVGRWANNRCENSHQPFRRRERAMLRFRRMGVPNLGGAVVTQSGLTFIGATSERMFRAYETATGKELWRARLPAGGQATPMTYISPASGRQFVVIAAGGHAALLSRRGDYIIAYALPKCGGERRRMTSVGAAA